MRSLISISFCMVLLFSLCSCGNNNLPSNEENSETAVAKTTETPPEINTASTEPPIVTEIPTATETPIPEKGSMSNPYSINDEINITAYRSLGYDYVTNKRNVGNRVTFQFSKIEYSNYTDTYNTQSYFKLEQNELCWQVAFNVKIVDFEISDALKPCDYVSLGCYSNSGVNNYMEGGVDFNNFNLISVLPGYDIDTYQFFYTNSGDDLEWITMKYYDETGGDVTIYISTKY